MTDKLYSDIVQVYLHEKNVFNSVSECFKLLMTEAENLISDYNKNIEDSNVDFSINIVHDHIFELTVGSDVIVFFLHPNIFEFSRNHEVMRTKYIQDDKKRAQCGTILIYNYLADSIKYRRSGDIGYLIGRILINNEKHFYTEGKKEIGMLLNRFENNLFDKDAAVNILKSSIEYVIHFALLVPDFDIYKEMSVDQFLQMRDHMQIKTAKRLGFRFQADKKE